MTTEIRLLGPMEVLGSAGEIRLGGNISCAVLALLALAGGRSIPAESLLDAAWDVTPGSGVRSLHVVVSRLRAALAETTEVTIRLAGSGYALDAPAECVDSIAVENAARFSRDEAHPARRSQILAEALARWRGPALEEFSHLPVLAAESYRLAQLRISLLEERVDADLAAGEGSSLVGELETLVASEPLRQRPWGQLMLALHRSGRQADALRAFQRCRSVLGEAGLAPGPHLTTLEQQIALHDPVLDRPSPAAAAVAPGWRLILATPDRRISHDLDEAEATIGSDAGNHIVIDDRAVSRVHARLRWAGSSWVISDLASRNGLWVNGEKIDHDRVLDAGDGVRVGRSVLTLEFDARLGGETDVLPDLPRLDAVQHEVLHALCRPLLDGDLLTPPASLDEVSEATGARDAASILDQLADNFGIDAARSELRWTQLARVAVTSGVFGSG